MTDLRKAADTALEILETDQSQLHWQAFKVAVIQKSLKAA